MSNFTPTVERTFHFDGDTVSVRLHRLKRKDMQQLIPHIHTDDEGNTKMSFEDQVQLMNVMADLLPEYVESIHGLVDANGQPLEAKVIAEQVYFMDLLVELTAALFEESNLGEEGAKNSGAPSGGSSEGTPT